MWYKGRLKGKGGAPGDHLGSHTVIASGSGITEQESMLFPYGGERWSTGADTNHYKFTGKERDAETGLDYFGARYYASNMGRWMSPDLAAISLRVIINPQRWNRYSYVLNAPMGRVDPDGYADKLVTVYFMRDDIVDVARKPTNGGKSPMTVGRLYMFGGGKSFETTYMEPPKQATTLHPKGRVASGEYAGFFKAHLGNNPNVLSVLGLSGVVPASVDGKSFTGISLHGGRYADNSEGCAMYSNGSRDRDQALELIDALGVDRSKVKFKVIYMEGQWDTAPDPPLEDSGGEANGYTMPPPTPLQQVTCGQDPVCSGAQQIIHDWEREHPAQGPSR